MPLTMETKEQHTTPHKPATIKPRGQSIYELIETPRAAQVLPSLGSVIKELEQVLNNNKNAPLQDISRLIRSDQSMALRILRLANSAYYAPTEPVINVEDSLIFLGLNQVRSSILTARCIEKTCHLDEELFSWKDFWSHAVAVGCITQNLSRYLPEPKLAEQSYYVMGLLHDIGKLVLAQVSTDDFSEIIEIAQKRNTHTSEVETELLGIDHSCLGAWYLQQQGMPPSLVEPVRLHHAWQVSASNSNHAALICLADEIAHQQNYGFSGSHFPEDFNYQETSAWQHMLEICGIDEKSLENFILQIDNDLERLPSLIKTLVS